MYQVTFRPDEVNCNVHETLALTMDQDTETTRKPLSTFKKINNPFIYIFLVGKRKLTSDNCVSSRRDISLPSTITSFASIWWL